MKMFDVSPRLYPDPWLFKGGGNVKQMKYLASSFLLTASIAAGEAKVKILAQEPWSNVYGGKEAVFHFGVSASESFKGVAAWSLSSSGRALARREQEVSAGPGQPATIEIRVEAPPVKEGVVLEAALAVSVLEPGGKATAASIEKRIWIFAEDPFAGHREWIKQAQLRLFDPQKKTAERLSKAKVDFDQIASVDALGGIKDGLVVIGEGVSLRDYRGLAETMVRCAASGVPVLCLALSGGEMTLPGMGDSDLPQPTRMALRGNDVITELDKHLDAAGWPPDGKIAVSGLKLKGERGPVVGEVVKEGGWPWLEMRFGGKGASLAICGFGVIEKWETGPTPGCLFEKMLERVGR
jgi:hypothetical protein